MKCFSQETVHIIREVEKLKSFDLYILTWRENEQSWSILECLEHLNRYGDYYLSQIEEKIKNSNKKFDPVFRTGLLGDYFAKSMCRKKT